MNIDLEQAVRIDLPQFNQDLCPGEFRTGDGLSGWAVRLPGQRPIATPAYADGFVFVGGGYGSYEFYAFDAESGRTAWQLRTADDGPTAAVVAEGFVAFNTESCTVVVCEARTGRVVWQEWLGDPLMAQPAIDQGKLFMAYPGGWQRPVYREGMSQEEQAAASQAAKAAGRKGFEHWLLCADLRTGRHLWEQAISGDVISAPVVDDGRVYVSCLDGRMFCVDVDDGRVIWERDEKSTCAPVVVNGEVIHTEKQHERGQAWEAMRRRHSHSGAYSSDKSYWLKQAGYLRKERSGGVGVDAQKLKDLDASVGFSHAPSSAKLHAAEAHLGTPSVSAAWLYQGSRPVYAKAHLINAQGRTVNRLRASDDKETWRAKASGRGVTDEDQVFCPPAVGRDHIYLCSTRGHLLALHQDTCGVRFLYDIGHPVAFQPALASGSMLFGTADGLLVCLRTGSDDADGWPMWGGNIQHNRCS